MGRRCRRTKLEQDTSHAMIDDAELYERMCYHPPLRRDRAGKLPQGGLFPAPPTPTWARKPTRWACSSHLQDGDIVFSNHRCHGHFLAYGGDPRALFAELMGAASGVCGGRGGSQHLHWRNFYSNGVQGGIVPVATGMALAEKRKAQRGSGDRLPGRRHAGRGGGLRGAQHGCAVEAPHPVRGRKQPHRPDHAHRAGAGGQHRRPLRRLWHPGARAG